MKCIAEKVIDIAFMTEARLAIAAVLCTTKQTRSDNVISFAFIDKSTLHYNQLNPPMQEWLRVDQDGNRKFEGDL